MELILKTRKIKHITQLNFRKELLARITRLTISEHVDNGLKNFFKVRDRNLI